MALPNDLSRIGIQLQPKVQEKETLLQLIKWITAGYAPEHPLKVIGCQLRKTWGKGNDDS